MGTLTAAQEFMINLERERYDVTWRTPREKHAPPAPTVIVRQRNVSAREQRTRDRIMFNAGRYAAGARDEEATTANQQVGKIIQKGNK
jgi:hypothetical protein